MKNRDRLSDLKKSNYKQMKSPIPHIIHIGIPKSGSTSLQEVFGKDSRILLSRSRFYTSADWWDGSIFEHHDNKVVVESNETLLSGGYQKVKFCQVVERLHKTNPNAQLIIVLRNQPKAVMSMYKFHILNAFWGIKNFNHWLFRTDLGMDYLSLCMYGNIVRTLTSYFPKNQIHLLFFEELIANPFAFYSKVYEVLDLDFKEIAYPKSNENSFNEDQLYTLVKLNKLALFKRKSENRFYSSKGHQIEQTIKFKLIKFFSFKKNPGFFDWNSIPQKEKLFQEFKETNQDLIELGMVTRDDLVRFGYLLPE